MAWSCTIFHHIWTHMTTALDLPLGGLDLSSLAIGLNTPGGNFAVHESTREKAITLHLAIWDCRWAVNPTSASDPEHPSRIHPSLERQIAARYHANKRKERRR